MSASSSDRLDWAGLHRRWPTIVALVAMWIALWEGLSWANLISGTLVACAVVLIAGQISPRPVQNFRIVPALRYLVTFAKLLIVASYQVVVAVLRPSRIQPGIVAMPLQHVSDAVVTLVANSITLTPGTMTLETERDGDTAILYVHAIDLSDVEAVRNDVRLLEKLAIAAFGGHAAEAEQADPGAVLTERDDGSGAGPAGHRDDGSGLA
jgi:multicomponent Na+:H+ antiporter subunit E